MVESLKCGVNAITSFTYCLPQLWQRFKVTWKLVNIKFDDIIQVFIIYIKNIILSFNFSYFFAYCEYFISSMLIAFATDCR